MGIELDDVLWLDATSQAELIRSGEVDAADLLEAAIARCDEVNPSLNAVIHRNDDLARDRLAGVDPDAPFAGVPMLTKDLLCCEAGLPFHEGSRFLKEVGYTPDYDQVLAVRFREAGLVSFGRTNTPEFGMRPRCEPLAYGPTNNPWNLAHSPGGSSGGSAASVAAGVVSIAHANDVGGSIRNPASNCNLFGLKPARGRSNLGPDFGDAMGGLAEELVVTRSVRDSARALDALSLDSPAEWYQTPGVGGGFASFEEAARTEPSSMRIGVLAEPPPDVHPGVAETVRSMGRLLESLGHRVDETAPAALVDTDVSEMTLPHYTAGTAHFVDHYWPRVLGRPIPEDQIEPATAFLADLGRSVTGGALLEARELAQHWTRRLVSWWLDDGYDLLLLPVLADPPIVTGGGDDARIVALAAPFNLSGLPAASVPGGFVDGLPVGVQFVAAPWREDVIFQLAAQVERARPWFRRPSI